MSEKIIDQNEEMLNMALELMALSTKTDNPYVQKLLENFSVGIKEMESDCFQYPFLEPVPIDNADFTYKGNGDDVIDLHCKTVNGAQVSVWRCNNFWFRWRFLTDGMIALSLYGTPPPLILRMDPHEMGFNIT